MDNCITMIKYQGLGNDYLVLDPNKNRVQLQGKKIALLCQRGFGLGADGILYGPIEIDGKMGVRIFNSDGSEAAISGNGVRIFAKYLKDASYVQKKNFKLYTGNGPVEVTFLNEDGTYDIYLYGEYLETVTSLKYYDSSLPIYTRNNSN